MKIKVSKSILNSNFWISSSPTVKVVFFQLLAMADNDGFVDACVPAVGRISGLSGEETVEVLNFLFEPEMLRDIETFARIKLGTYDRGWTVEVLRERVWRGGEPGESGPDQVYFAQCDNGGPVKIGMSNNPISRVYALNTSNPSKVHLLATMPGGRELEREMHERFAGYRLNGEWFDPARELLDFISTIEEPALEAGKGDDGS